jgi:hypothetical protein
MKTCLGFATPLLASLPVWSQGTVVFNNGGITFPTAANRYVYSGTVIGSRDDTDTSQRLVGTNGEAGLWYVLGAENSARLSGGLGGTQAGSIFTFRQPTTRFPGTWLLAGNICLALDGVAVGESATLQVRVWDSMKNPSYAAAREIWDVNIAAPFNYTVPQPSSTPLAYYMDNLRAFDLVP